MSEPVAQPRHPLAPKAGTPEAELFAATERLHQAVSGLEGGLLVNTAELNAATHGYQGVVLERVVAATPAEELFSDEERAALEENDRVAEWAAAMVTGAAAQQRIKDSWYTNRLFIIQAARQRRRAPGSSRWFRGASIPRAAAVAVLPVDEAWQRFALVRHAGVDALGALVVEAPAGNEGGESSLDMARRALEEELGIAAGRVEPVASRLLVPSRCTGERIDLVIASYLSVGSKADEDTEIELVWTPVARLDAAVRDADQLVTYALLQELRHRLRSGQGLISR